MIFKLQGTYQHYDWGGKHFIPQWLKLTDPDDKPYAEYWLGSHRSSPSIVEIKGEKTTLTQLLDKQPNLLGQKSRSQFGDELPFLLKILDVKQPLSIQLHPTKKQAEQGFDQENQAGISLTAPNRTYKDRNHKPEMMIALSDFWLLHGFKPIDEIKQNLSANPSLVELANALDFNGIEPVYTQIMQAEQAQLAKWILPILAEKQDAYQQGKLALSSPDYWLFYTMETMNILPEKLDAGLLCFYLFNIVQVNKGEGIYQGAGLPHAYLRGQCIELMAASDNVIRGGLTPKYVDIPALLKTIDYQEVIPQLLAPAEINEQQKRYHYPTPDAKDFALQNLAFNAFDEERFCLENAAILLVMSGSLHLDFGKDSLYLEQGESAFIAAGSQVDLVGDKDGYAVIATLP